MFAPILLVLATFYAPKVTLPSTALKCLAEHSEVKLDLSQSPHFLREHFAAGGAATLVLPIVYRGAAISRILMCPVASPSVILGARDGLKFSDMDGDDYMATKWRVCGRTEVLSMEKFYKEVPMPENQSVCLTWEDGEAVIYWDQGQYKWKSLSP